MLGGRVDHQLDEKKRMRIPAMYMNSFNGEPLFYVAYAPDCITIMPKSVKDRRLGSLDEVDPGDPELMDAMRIIYASVMPVEVDNQGRAKIPKPIRERLHLEKEIVTIGLSDFIEVWDRETYEKKTGAMSLADANKIYYSRKQRREQDV